MSRPHALIGLRQRARHLIWGVWLVTVPAFALQDMDDADLAQVDGGGLSFVLENFKFQMAPQSFIEQVGAAPTGGTTLQQGDYYWMGLSISGDGSSGQQWAPTAAGTPNTCSTSKTSSGTASTVAGNLGCAVGSNVIANLAAFDNPYVLRAFSYTAPDENNNSAIANTVLELMAPSCVGQASSSSAAPALGCGSSTQQPEDTYRWAFWGSVVVTKSSGATASASGQLKSQTIVDGINAAYFYPQMVATTAGSSAAGRPNMYQGAVMRMFRTIPDSINTANSDNATLGLTYASELSGNFRFSVGQTGSTDADTCTGTGGNCSLANVAVVPNFDNTEGLYFRNVQAYLPLGQLNYQSIVAGASGTVASPNGNFDLELTVLPNEAPAYNDAYSLEASDTTGYATAHDAQCTMTANTATQCGSGTGTGNWTAVPVRYFETHGYVEWGTGVSSTYALPDDPDGSGSLGTRPYSPPAACTGSGAISTACYTSTSDGIYFASGNSLTQTFTASAASSDPELNKSYSTSGLSTVNLGTATMQGLLFQHLKITTLGAN